MLPEGAHVSRISVRPAPTHAESGAATCTGFCRTHAGFAGSAPVRTQQSPVAPSEREFASSRLFFFKKKTI